jgi:hypothetical protein
MLFHVKIEHLNKRKRHKKHKIWTYKTIKNLFPDHEPLPEEKKYHMNYIRSKEPMICKFERKGKATTIIEGYEGR